MDRQTTRTHTQLRRAQRKAAKARKGQGQQPRGGQKPGRQTPPKTTVQKSWTPRLAKVEAVVTDDSSTILKVLATFCASAQYKAAIATGSPVSVKDYRSAFEIFAVGHDRGQMEAFNKAIVQQKDLVFTVIATALATHAIAGLTINVFEVFNLKIGPSEKTTLANLGWLREQTGKVTKVAFGRRTSRESVFSALIQVPEEQMLKLEGTTPKSSSSLTGIQIVESMLANANSPLSQLKGYCGYDNRIAKLQSGIGGSHGSKKLQVG